MWYDNYPYPTPLNLSSQALIDLGNECVAGLTMFEPSAPAEHSFESLVLCMEKIGFTIHRLDGFAHMHQIMKYDTIFHNRFHFETFVCITNGPISRKIELAHALAHFILHTDENMMLRSSLKTSKDKQIEKAETETYWFSLGVLLPTEQTQRLINNGKTAEQIAKMFSVSQRMAEQRIQLLQNYPPLLS